MSSDINEKQVGGDHYKIAIQPWDYIIANNLGYLEGNVIKYVSRHAKKNGVQDLEKAKHYLEKLIEGYTVSEDTGLYTSTLEHSIHFFDKDRNK